MATILQLSPPIEVYSKLGRGRALFIIDYGQDMNTIWIVALDKSGIIKHINSNDLVLRENATYGTLNEGLTHAWKEL